MSKSQCASEMPASTEQGSSTDQKQIVAHQNPCLAQRVGQVGEALVDTAAAHDEHKRSQMSATAGESKEKTEKVGEIGPTQIVQQPSLLDAFSRASLQSLIVYLAQENRFSAQEATRVLQLIARESAADSKSDAKSQNSLLAKPFGSVGEVPVDTPSTHDERSKRGRASATAGESKEQAAKEGTDQSNILAIEARQRAFAQRFGSVGEVLADALDAFSLDIVGIVAGYAVCGVAKAGAEPELLFSFMLSKAQEPTHNRHHWDYRDIATSPDGSRILVAYGHLEAFDADGKQLFCLSQHTAPEAVAVAVDASGQAFVLSKINSRSFMGREQNFVSALDADGKLLRKIKPDRDWHPQGLALHGDLLLVVDSLGHCIHEFLKDGVLVRSWGVQLTNAGARDCETPNDIAVSPRGEIYVRYDKPSGGEDVITVQVFGADGKFSRKFVFERSNEEWIHGLAFDRVDNLLVPEFNDDTDADGVQVLTADGELVTWFQTHSPADAHGNIVRCVHVDCNGRIFVGDDRGCVRVFAFVA